MAYWLCDKRGDQKSAPLMRFDPRYWTVNFPRPMMASVIARRADMLRVTAIFYHANEICGLIWDSEDRLDHPLLAYETNRDYRGLTLSFRWASSGIKPLDAIHGPTLTIEGRDQNGAPKTWYVRLWNYAQGTPTNAQINLKFNDLKSGFSLSETAPSIYAGDIDRMFISLVPDSFDNSDTVFAQGKEGHVTLSNIRCDGAGVMLDKGDVMLPEHSMKMATGYDDSYNQTPQRLLENIRALGYRDLINHYVGMSHYFQLELVGDEHYVALPNNPVNKPCRFWHWDFAKRAKDMGYDVILSLSYELFDAHCWNDWKQRTEAGDAALTGWVPPSTLLSPAHSGAMHYLQEIAKAFVGIFRQVKQPIKFQIGEPWWWVTHDGHICLYDDAAQAAFGDDLVSIPDINGPKSDAQNIMLDKAGELLAASTENLKQAAKNAASGTDFESLILVYLPTVLDAQAPEAKRANMPIGWAKPAFDILQLEDYDWVTSGNHGATRRAIEETNSRLNYPIERQHYLSGFILNKADSPQWEHIEYAANKSIKRGTLATFIWAEPQISRDGFTHYELGNVKMQPFDDVIFPLEIGSGASAIAEFSTNIVTTASGFESRNSDWADARQSYDVGPGVRSESELHILIDFFRARRGSAKAFRFSDPFDFSSNDMVAEPSMLDQDIGVGDGVQTKFSLMKYYGAGEERQQRYITRPRPDTIIISVDGVEENAWVLGEGGVIIFDQAPSINSQIKAGFLFDVPVRFTEDRLEVNRATFAAGEIPTVPLVEVREAD